jgi:glutamate carboxypeptidase
MSTAIESYLGHSADDVRASVLSRIRRYVEYETPSHHEAEIVALSEAVANDLRAIGATIEEHAAPGLGRNLVARLNGSEAASDRPLLLMAHMDTVHPVGTLAQRPFRITDDRAEGPGVYDMKSGLALMIEALAWHARRSTTLPRPVTLLVTCDEEIGSHSVRGLIDEHARAAIAVLVPEPCMPDGGVKTGRKGVATYRVETTGRAAHAGIEPGTAVSAIAELVQQCARIMQLADHAKGTTLNIGTIGGGSATNVVAAEAFAGVDVRLAVAAEGERIDRALRALTPVHPGATVRVELKEDRPPLVRTPAIQALYKQARACAERLGVDLKEGSTGGGSDGSLAAAAGAAVLDGLGPRGGGAHAVDEHILIEDLPFRLALLCSLIETI